MLIIDKDLGIECTKCGKSHDIDARELMRTTRSKLDFYDVKTYHMLYSVFNCECGNIMNVFYSVCEYPFGCLDEEIDESENCKITRFLAS